MLLKRCYAFCAYNSRMTQVLYNKSGEIEDIDRQYIFSIFKHTHMMNRDTPLQERSLALQMKIMPKLLPGDLKEAKQLIESLISTKSKYIGEIQTLLKIFQLQNTNVIDLDEPTLEHLIRNARVKIVGKVEHGFGNDGFLLNSFTENMFLMGRSDEATIAFLAQTYHEQLPRISIYNMLRLFGLVHQYQIVGMEDLETQVIAQLTHKIKFVSLFDCGNAARINNKMRDGASRTRFCEWIEVALQCVQDKLPSNTTPNKRLIMISNLGRVALTTYAEEHGGTAATLIKKLLALTITEDTRE